jgi:hypothetical protein
MPRHFLLVVAAKFVRMEKVGLFPSTLIPRLAPAARNEEAESNRHIDSRAAPTMMEAVSHLARWKGFP